ncbi:MAG: hypothetical protein AB7L91_06460 [Dehalococcoidia bacterium]
MLYEEVAEVAETGIHSVNLYLEHGYELLAVQQGAKPVQVPPSNVPLMVKRMVYVVGRRAETPHFDPPTRKERAAAASPEAVPE